jgi:hypothetical protein
MPTATSVGARPTRARNSARRGVDEIRDYDKATLRNALVAHNELTDRATVGEHAVGKAVRHPVTHANLQRMYVAPPAMAGDDGCSASQPCRGPGQDVAVRVVGMDDMNAFALHQPLDFESAANRAGAEESGNTDVHHRNP